MTSTPSKELQDWILARINDTDTVLVVEDRTDMHWFNAIADEADSAHKTNPTDFRDTAFPHRMYSVVLLDEESLDQWEKARGVAGPRGIVILSSGKTIEELNQLSGVFGWKESEPTNIVAAEGSESPVAEEVSVVITTIPVRQERLQRAINSVVGQTMLPAEMIVQVDENKSGAPANRDAGVARVKTKYVALLDDDDFFHPDHIETLYKTALETDADIVYSWFDMDGGEDPFPENFGKPWDPENPRQTTVTTLAKVDTIKKAGGYSTTIGLNEEQLATYAQGNTVGEDFRMVFSANEQGAKIVHVPKRTWSYSHWLKPDGTLGNTSGRPDRW